MSMAVSAMAPGRLIRPRRIESPVRANSAWCRLKAARVGCGTLCLWLIGLVYNYMFASHTFAGLFGDYDLSSLKVTIQDQNPFFAGEIKQTSAWAIGARVGWLISPSVLAYLNGGYSSAHFSA